MITGRGLAPIAAGSRGEIEWRVKVPANLTSRIVVDHCVEEESEVRRLVYAHDKYMVVSVMILESRIMQFVRIFLCDNIMYESFSQWSDSLSAPSGRLSSAVRQRGRSPSQSFGGT